MHAQKRTFSLVALILVVAAITSCQSQDPIIVYITPTHAEASASSPVPADSTVAPLTAEVSATPLPTEAPTETLTVTPVPPTATDVPTMVGTVPGPVTNPDYVLPTQAPMPTATPGPTLTPDLTANPPLPNLDPSQMGIQIDQERQFDEWAYALDRASQLGLGWIKIQVSWQTLQPNGPEQVEGPELDRLSDFLLNSEERGLRILVSVAKAPAWARTDQVEEGPPDDPQALANFLTFLFNRRGGYTIDAIEVWNEPNLAREWRGQPMTGAAYMRYFASAYNAIRAYSPTMPIVTAGLAPTSDSEVSRDDRAYLREMYAAGLSNYRDIYIGAHPYGWGNDPDARCCDLGAERGWDDDPHFFFLENLDAFRNIMNQNGHGDVQLWITEFGWATWDGFGSAAPEPWMTYIDRWDQARYTIRAFEIGQQRADVGVMFLWNMNFATQQLIERRDERAAYAIVTDYVRPTFWMVYDAVRPNETLDSYER